MEPKVEINLDRPTGNFWVDNGTAILAITVGEGKIEFEKAQSLFIPRLLRRGEDGDKWKMLAVSFIDGQKLKAFRERNVPFIPGSRLPKKANARCSICGEKSPTLEAKQFIYPFLVEGAKFANFLPNANQHACRLCLRCALASMAAYTGALWTYSYSDETLHIFLFYSELRELVRLYQDVFEPLSIQESKRGNIEAAFVGPYVHETTLGLILRMFSYMRRSDGLSTAGKNILSELLGASSATPVVPITLYAITGKPGQAFNMHSLKEFSKLTDLYRLYQSWIKMLSTDNPQHAIENIFRQFQKQEGNGYNTIWRDKVSQAILEFGDPLPFVERFLYEARAREENPQPLAWGTEEVFTKYTEEVLGMEGDLLDVLKWFGHSLGHRVQDQSEMGLLYSLRNSRNLDEFYRVLNDIQFKLGMTVPEQLLNTREGEKIGNTHWMRVKTMLSIYAMNSCLWAEGKTKQEASK